MAIPYEKLVEEDVNLGYGTVSVSMPAGGSATGRKFGIHSLLGGSVLNPLNHGAVGDGVASDSTALQSLLDLAAANRQTIWFPPGKIFKLTRGLIIPAYTQISGYGALLDASSLAAGSVTQVQSLVMQGSNNVGGEAAYITIEGLTLVGNSKGSTIFIYGGSNTGSPTFAHKPHDITIRDVYTNQIGSTLTAGIEIASASRVLIDGHYNVGGVAAVSAVAPIATPDDLYGLTIVNSTSINTVSYGYQVVYGRHTKIANCFVDGTVMNLTDKNGINLDRTQSFTISGNIVQNCPAAQILANGCLYGTIVGNKVDGGAVGNGILVTYNFDYLLDPTIDESSCITVVGNIVDGTKAAGNAIGFYGVKASTIVGNAIGPSGAAAEEIYVGDAVRGDSHVEDSEGISVVGNTLAIGAGTIHMAQAATDCQVTGNVASAYLGTYHDRVVNGVGGGLDFSNGVVMYRDAGTGVLTITAGLGVATSDELQIGGALNHDGTTVGFYGVAPTTRQLFATGAGHTVDQLISVLQTLGLIRQS